MKDYIKEFSKRLADFLSSSTQKEANKKINPVIKTLVNYNNRLERIKKKIEHEASVNNLKFSDVLSSEYRKNNLMIQRNYNDISSLIIQGYILIQEARKQFTGQEILYHTVIEETDGIKIIEFKDKDFLKFDITSLDVHSKTINDITIRLSESKKEFQNLDLQYKKENQILENETPSYQWPQREISLYYKFIELREELGIKKQTVTNGHIFEQVDRIAIMRQRLNRIVKWYSEDELKVLLKQRDTVESRKRADNLNIQNKAIRAQITSLGQTQRWVLQLIELLNSYKENINFFKENLIEMFTSKEQIVNDVFGDIEKIAVEESREYIQNLFTFDIKEI